MVIGGCRYFLWVWLLLVYVWQLLEKWLLVGVVISYGCVYCWFMCSNCLRNDYWWVWLFLISVVIAGHVWQLLGEWLLVGVFIYSGCGYVWLLLIHVWQLHDEWFLVGVFI